MEVYDSQGQSALQNIAEQLAFVERDLQVNRDLLEDLLTGSISEDQGTSVQDLDTRIRIQEQTYASLLNEYDKARITEALRANSISIVVPALAPSTPSKPNIPLNIVLGAVLGMSGGIALAFLVDNLDTSIQSAEDLERIVRAPVLGRIPLIPQQGKKMDGGLLVDTKTRTLASEAFRVLRTNLLSLKHVVPPKLLLVTSADPGVENRPLGICW